MKFLKAMPLAFGAVPLPKKSVASRAYAGAMLGRLTSDWVAMGTSADSEIKGSLRALRNRSRQLGRDNDYVKGFYQTVQDNVVGTGIPFQAQVFMQRGGQLNKDLNAKIEQAWSRWSVATSCHTGGTQSFQDIERMAIRNHMEAGEFFVRMIKGQKFGKSKIPFALELIEADLLDDQKSEILPNGNTVRMGVELDQWQRPVAYYFLQNHPGDYQFSNSNPALKMHRRVPAEEIIALQTFDRPSQVRSVPALASAIMRLHHLGGMEEAEVVAARAASSLMGFIETDGDEAPNDDVEYDQAVSDFEPGSFKTLLPGQKANIPDMHKPAGQFEPFVRIMLRGMAAGASVSYSTISRDYSQSNFSSSRMDLLNERDHWKTMQQWLLRKFHQIVFENWLEMAVMSGELPLPGYELQPEKYQAVKWMPRGWAWIDPVKEITAAKEAIRGGLATQTDIAAQQGLDFDELCATRAREKETAEEYGLKFDTDVAVVAQDPNAEFDKNEDDDNANDDEEGNSEKPNAKKEGK